MSLDIKMKVQKENSNSRLKRLQIIELILIRKKLGLVGHTKPPGQAVIKN